MAMIGFLSTLFVGMTLINRVLEGKFITGAEAGILNQLTIIRVVVVNTFVGSFPFPVLNLDYLTGLMRLVKFDYGFFGGEASLIQFFFYALTAALQFVLFTIIIGLIGQWTSRR